MISAIEAAAPEFLVFVRVSFSWLEQKDSNRLVLDWADQYARSNYRAVGLVDIESMDRTVYSWDEKGVVATPRSEYFVWIFKRNDSSRGAQAAGL